MKQSHFQINESELKEAAYKKFKSNYVVEADITSAKSPVTVDGDNEAIKAIKEVLDLDGDWKAQWIVSNNDNSYTVRMEKPDFRPIIVKFIPTIGHEMTFTMQFGEDGNCDNFDDDTPPDDPVIEISRFIRDENSRFAEMAKEFRKRTEELEKEAGDAKAETEDAAQSDADMMGQLEGGSSEGGTPEGGDQQAAQ